MSKKLVLSGQIPLGTLQPDAQKLAQVVIIVTQLLLQKDGEEYRVTTLSKALI